MGRVKVIDSLLANGFEWEFVLEVYFKEIRSILEYGAVIFHFGLTRELSEKIEGIQRIILRLVSSKIGLNLSYMEQCIYFGVEQLFSRRLSLCERFVTNISKSNVHSDFFIERKIERDIQNLRKYQEYKSNSVRHFNSPKVALTRLKNRMTQ